MNLSVDTLFNVIKWLTHVDVSNLLSTNKEIQNKFDQEEVWKALVGRSWWGQNLDSLKKPPSWTYRNLFFHYPYFSPSSGRFISHLMEIGAPQWCSVDQNCVTQLKKNQQIPSNHLAKTWLVHLLDFLNNQVIDKLALALRHTNLYAFPAIFYENDEDPHLKALACIAPPYTIDSLCLGYSVLADLVHYYPEVELCNAIESSLERIHSYEERTSTMEGITQGKCEPLRKFLIASQKLDIALKMRAPLKIHISKITDLTQEDISKFQTCEWTGEWEEGFGRYTETGESYSNGKGKNRDLHCTLKISWDQQNPKITLIGNDRVGPFDNLNIIINPKEGTWYTVRQHNGDIVVFGALYEYGIIGYYGTPYSDLGRNGYVLFCPNTTGLLV